MVESADSFIHWLFYYHTRVASPCVCDLSQSILNLLYEVQFLWLLELLIALEILWECLFKVRKVSSLLSFCWILLIELGPGALSFAEFLECALMGLLLIKFRVFEDLLIFILVSRVNPLELFRITQPRVEHPLIISYQSHFPSEAFVPVILRPRVNILLLLERGSVWLISSSVVINLRILPQIVEECSLLVGRLIDLLQATCTVRDVRIPAATIICIVHWFRMDVCQRLCWSLFCYNEWTYKKGLIRTCHEGDKGSMTQW